MERHDVKYVDKKWVFDNILIKHIERQCKKIEEKSPLTPKEWDEVIKLLMDIRLAGLNATRYATELQKMVGDSSGTSKQAKH